VSVVLNRERLLLITPPIVEPVTLAETKTYVGQDLDHHDDLLRSLIAAARSSLEQTYGVAFMPQTWDQAAYWATAADPAPIRLLRTPVTEIVSVTSIDPVSGALRLVPGARLTPGPRLEIPASGVTVPGAYVVRFVAGYGRQTAAAMTFDNDSTITRDAGSFVDDGFSVGDTIYTSNTKGGNAGPLTIVTATALVLTVAESLAPDGPLATFVASAAGMPEALRVGLLATVAWLYEHRGDDAPAAVPPHVDRLVAIYGVPKTP
jgi:uncharacterized phiE125 gp8 family phage protein